MCVCVCVSQCLPGGERCPSMQRECFKLRLVQICTPTLSPPPHTHKPTVFRIWPSSCTTSILKLNTKSRQHRSVRASEEDGDQPVRVEALGVLGDFPRVHTNGRLEICSPVKAFPVKCTKDRSSQNLLQALEMSICEEEDSKFAFPFDPCPPFPTNWSYVRPM